MQDEAAERAQHHQTIRATNGLRTSNATSSHFLGGQQRSWMLPTQALDIVQQDQSSNTLATQARQMNTVIGGLLSNTSGVIVNSSRAKAQALLQEANRAIEEALDSGHHGAAQQNYLRMQPNKRPRLDIQLQSPSVTVTGGRGAPLYSFVSSPDQEMFSPGLPGHTVSPPPATPLSSSSPIISSSNINQVHTATSAQIPRRQSSHMSAPGGGIPVAHSEMWLQQPAQPRLTTSISDGRPPPAQRPSTPKRTSTIRLLSILQTAMNSPTTRDAFQNWARRRIMLLEEACKCEDWFYLTLHQVYCWRTLNKAVLERLGITGMREVQLANLDAILLPNTKLQFLALDWFSQFPTDQNSILQGLSPDASNALKLMHTFLDKMALQWSQVSASCLARNYPPSPYELYDRLGMSSTVLQKIFFTFIFRQIEGGDDQGWVDRATKFFKFTQSQLIDKFNRINQGLPEAPPNNDTDLLQFASEYFALRNKHATRPVLTGNVRGALSAVPRPPTMSASQANPMMSATRPQPSELDFWTPENQRSATLPSQQTQSGLYSDANSGVGTNITQRSMSRPQPAHPSSSPVTSSIGPRQQAFVQEMTGAPIMPGIRGSDSRQRGPGLPNTPLHPTARLPSGAIPATFTGRPPAPVSQSGSLMMQTKDVLQKPHRLLPPAGKLMTQNTNPNPHQLALHQARVFSPEPSMAKLGGTQQASPRLFQVFRRFTLAPQMITNQQSYYQWQIDVPAADIARKASDVFTDGHTSRPAAKMSREFKPGSLLYRLRCIKIGSGLNESDWSTAQTYWPNSCFVSLNADEIEVRRKSHWGKNLPCDLTRRMKTGINIVEMSVNLGPEEHMQTFAIAVEQVETFDQTQCTNQLELIEQAISLATIVASLTASENDDDIAIVDPHISIDLIDPFTARMWKIPVRGKMCTHRECFDLHAFLDSRPNKHKGVQVSGADDWKCPICNKDARPQCLVLDGFLLSVCVQLRASGNEGEEVRAIQVDPDGCWKPAKIESMEPRRETNVRDGLAQTNSERSTPSVNASKETVLREARLEPPVVVELDDD